MTNDCLSLQQLNHPNVIRYISNFVENNEVGVGFVQQQLVFVFGD